MAELEQIGGGVRSELALAYLRRSDVDGDEGEAAARFAHDLTRGDPASFKEGYSPENALIAAFEVFPAAPQGFVKARLTELVSTSEPVDPGRPKGVLGLTEWEQGLVLRALGDGEPLDRDEVIHLTKVARLAQKRRDEVRDRVLAVVEHLESEPADYDDDPRRETAEEMRASLAAYEEATTLLLEAVAAAKPGVSPDGE